MRRERTETVGHQQGVKTAKRAGILLIITEYEIMIFDQARGVSFLVSFISLCRLQIKCLFNMR